MNKDKLFKIFDIYRELNRIEEIKFSLPFNNFDKKISVTKKITIILTPDSFTINGDFSTLSKDNLNKIMDELKNFIDNEYERLKIKISSLKDKF